jgi:hypothetical protein
MRWTWMVLIGACMTEPVKPDGDPPAVDRDVTPPADSDTDPPPEEEPDAPVTVRITESPEDPVPVGTSRDEVRGRVSARDVPVEQLVLTWRSDLDGELPGPIVDPANGQFVWTTGGLTPGVHTLTLTARTPAGEEATAEVEVQICDYEPAFTFDAGIGTGDWRLYGDAYWDAGGWIEITGVSTNRKGGIYRTGRRINPGDLAMEFRIATGGGTGADGFSVNIIDAPDLPALENLIALGRAGGCLAYGTDNGYCGTTPMNAFHIEFDTWYNGEPELADPTTENHVEITLNGNPGRHFAWVAVPSLENLQWRLVQVVTRGARVTVWMDGTIVIDQTIPGFSFDGGYIGVTGSTGAFTNYHRFDDLRVFDVCTVPGAPDTGP